MCPCYNTAGAHRKTSCATSRKNRNVVANVAARTQRVRVAHTHTNNTHTNIPFLENKTPLTDISCMEEILLPVQQGNDEVQITPEMEGQNGISTNPVLKGI